MFKSFKLSTLALAAALAVAVPTISLARDHDDRGRGNDRNEYARGRDWDRHNYRDRDWDRHAYRDYDRGSRFGFGIYVNPTPVAPAYDYAPTPANGYYDQYGYWHSYGY